MIRVLHIQETIGSGGVERLRLSLAKYLDRSAFELKIICTFTIGDMADEIRAQGVEVIAIGKFHSVFDYRQHRKVQAIIRQFKPGIIHGAVFEGVTMAAINGFIARVPLVILEETSDPQNRSWRGNLLMRLFCTMAHKVIAVSPGVAEYLLGTLKLPSKQVQLINNGVAIPREVTAAEKTELREQLGIGTAELVIGSIGRMLHDEHKRFSDLISTLAMLLERGYPVKLLLVGDGPERQRYAQLAEELGVSDRVIFCGYQHDVAKYYALMDIFSLVSAYEAFGLVLAEAMLHKIPVVASRVGGMKYIVEDQQTGFLVAAKDVPQITAAIAALCDDEALRLRLGENGFNKAMKTYTADRYVKALSALYLSLAGKDGKHG